VFRFHSCGNRHCPTCHGPHTERWLETQRAQLLPCPYYLVTFTLPRDLRALAVAHQRLVYGVLMRSAAAALQCLAADPRYVGARVGCLAVLHTWTRAMLYHPHVHLLVTAGGLSADGTQWIAPKNPAFLVPVQALSVIFRAKVCAGLRRAGLLDQVAPSTWTTPWVVHAQHAGCGQRVLDYLGRYVFRIAIANSRLEQVTEDDVTFRYRDNRTPGGAPGHAHRRGVSAAVSAARAPARLCQSPLLRPLERRASRGSDPGARPADRPHCDRRAADARASARVIPRGPPDVSALSCGHADRPRRAPTVVDAAAMTTRLTPRPVPALHTPLGRERRRVGDRSYPHVTGAGEPPLRRSHPRPPHRQMIPDRLLRRLTAPLSLAETG
jgi:hypothetical protein